MSDRVLRIREALAEGLDTDDIAIRDDSHLHRGHEGAKTGLGHFHVTIRSPRFLALSTALDNEGATHSVSEPLNRAPRFSRNSAHSL